MRLPEPQSPVEEILRAGHFRQRIFVREAMDAANIVLPESLAKLIRLEFEGSINFSDRFGASPLVLHAAADVLDMARDLSPDWSSDTA